MVRVFRRRWPLAIRLLTAIGGVLLVLGLGLQLLPERPPQEALFAPPPPTSDILLTASDRVLILAPHPDDEVLGCGGVIQAAVKLHIPLHVAYLTYGDSNEWSFIVYSHRPVMGARSTENMGEVRHDEAVAADGELGVPPQDITFLGYPDHGCLDIFTSHWGDRPPLTALLTRARSVPYANALRPGAPYKGDEILKDLETVIRNTRPTRIFVSHPADGNVDHRALYLYTRVALWDLAAELQPAPEVHPYLVHWPHWPRPSGFHPDSQLAPPANLKQQLSWHLYPLENDFIGIKREALKLHKTQMSYSAAYLTAFVKQNELFSDLARLDLTRCLPHAPTASPAQALPDCAEPSSLVGNEWRFVRLDEDNRLELSIEEARSLALETQASFYALGYRPGHPFASMPKIHVQVGPLNSSADDQGRRVTAAGLEMSRRGRRITVKIPMSLLGDPDRVLVSSRTWLGTVALDWNVWYEIDLPGSAGTLMTAAPLLKGSTGPACPPTDSGTPPAAGPH